MFSIDIKPFGQTKIISAYNQSGLKIEVLPDYGAALNAFHIPDRNGNFQNIIDGYLTDQEPFETKAYYKGVFLFPFPNRLRDGKWSSESTEFSFPINEIPRNNALHGILFNRSFAIVETSATAEMAFIHLRYSPDALEPYFPFNYQIDIEFILTESHGVTIKTLVTNKDQKPMPFGLGWHPYFKTGSKVDDLIFHIPGINAINVDNRMIPTGNQIPYHFFDHPQPLKGTELDTGFTLNSPGLYKTEVFDTERKLKFFVWQESGLEGYGYLQIYTPPGRETIAIEPMTCMANALQTGKDGLIHLEPGQSMPFEWGIGTH
jgi:aldose 1-epimerase